MFQYGLTPRTSAIITHRVVPAAIRIYAIAKTGYRIHKAYKRFGSNGIDPVMLGNLASAALSSVSYLALMTRRSLAIPKLFIKTNRNLSQVLLVVTFYVNSYCDQNARNVTWQSAFF